MSLIDVFSGSASTTGNTRARAVLPLMCPVKSADKKKTLLIKQKNGAWLPVGDMLTRSKIGVFTDLWRSQEKQTLSEALYLTR